MEQVGKAPQRTFTLKSSVADSHARTVAALHAPDVPSEVNNFQTYFIGVSESDFSPFFFSPSVSVDLSRLSKKRVLADRVG